MRDWLGNDLNVGDLVLYSSTSTLTGMNLGEITSIADGKIQLKLLHKTSTSWNLGRKLTLHQHTSAYRSVTRYYGAIPYKLEGTDGQV